MSPTEIRLWRVLRLRPGGLLFRRQHPLGPFVLDFYCKAAAVAIEVDGSAHDFQSIAEADVQRDQWMQSRGIRTIRIAADDVRKNLEGVLTYVVERCQERTPPPHGVRSPSPSNAGEDA